MRPAVTRYVSTSARVLLAVTVLLGTVAAWTPGFASPAGPGVSTTGGADRAEAEAAEAARTVQKLTDQYLDRTRAVSTATQDLADAFATTARLEAEEAATASRLAAASVNRGRLVRAYYAQGGGMGLASSILAADSPEAAMWRMSTVDRLWREALGDAEEQVARWRAATELTARRRQEAARVDADRVAALEELRGASQDAEEALGKAKKTLKKLNARARSLREVEEAQRRLDEASREQPTEIGPVSALGIPVRFERAYRNAAKTCPGLAWTLLAAVGQVESGHGKNNGPSSAGAIGPMQFMPATFESYAVDGNGDGIRDPWNVEDAVFTAAAYLCVSGAGGGTTADIRSALLRYNRAEWYVNLVLSTERAIVAAERRQGGGGVS